MAAVRSTKRMLVLDSQWLIALVTRDLLGRPLWIV